MSLRPPQQESLEVFAKICDILSMKKNPNTDNKILEDYSVDIENIVVEAEKDKFIRKKVDELASDFCKQDLNNVRKHFPTLKSFERNFPSLCFALATGIGKTRLMGACIAYLHYEKGVNNFFVMAPNLTIYRKLISDLGNPSNSKYVFKGLDKFSAPPKIINGENYEYFSQQQMYVNDVVINIFNISKLNSDSKAGKGEPAKIKRLKEVLGQSYFDYLRSLPDLCIFMDESHHYHADKSFEVINDLHPILGVELTATPQIQKGSRKTNFENVVYEYSLAHALNDGMYVKVPVVFTRKDFHPDEYTPEQLDHEKLNDGIRIHEETKSKLEIYSRTFNKSIVKPFVLVVAKDTDHSKEIRSYMTSKDFFGGYYKDKVLEINSAQRGAEKDENIEQLLSLELPDNTIEIVIHVNMLKEGWDVTNLYTIVPLRASASETLTEQTIGRGLRLPYGQRTGVDEVDRLSIVSHDKYEAIINLANDPNSLVRKVYYIDEMELEEKGERETVEMPTYYDDITTDVTFTEQLALTLRETITFQKDQTQEKIIAQTNEVAKFVTQLTSKSVLELSKQVKTYDAAKDPEAKQLVQKTVIAETIRQFSNIGLKVEDLTKIVEKAIETCVQALTDRVIPIPQTVVQPFTEIKQGFYEFTLNTSNMKWHPSDATLIGTELQEGGNTFEYESYFRAITKVDSAENEVVRHIIIHDNVDYTTCSELIYSLITDAKKHFLSYLNEEDTEKVMRDRQKTIADIIYAQMNQHFYKEEVNYRASEMRPFSRLETGFGAKNKIDEIFDLRANISPGEVKSKVFNGFKKACHSLYKFDSNTERIFAIILENDSNVLKWMRPSSKQFNIYYGPGGISRYEPDFIVETCDFIYMIETKASNEMKSEMVLEKAKAAKVYCDSVSEWNKENGGKEWDYALIPHDEVKLNSSLKYLLAYKVGYEQLELDLLSGK